MSVSIFHLLEPVEFIILKKPELNPAFHHRMLILLLQTRKQQLFYGNFYKDTVIIWTCQQSTSETWGEHHLATSRVSIVMFAGKSAKC